MLKLKTKWFNKWAKKNLIPDKILLDTLTNISKNLAINLGGGLYKVRTPNVVFKEEDIAIFVYGFAKSDKDNLEKDELSYFKKLSKDLLSLNRLEFVELEKAGDFISIKE